MADAVNNKPLTEHSEYHKPSMRHVAGQIGAAHLYIEDADGHVIERARIPRPTNDPRDPLSWSASRRHLAFVAISSVVFLSNFSIGTVTPGLTRIIEEFDISLSQASYLITAQILTLGVGNLFWIPLCLKFGKRPTTIISVALFLATSIWSTTAKSYNSLLAARILQGFGASSSEALGPAIIADVYFLHERGTMVGIYTMAIAIGAAFGGIFAGITVHYTNSWRWGLGLHTILTGISFLMILFFLAETNFDRPAESELGLEAVSISDHGTAVEVAAPRSALATWAHSLKAWGWYDHKTSLLTHFWWPIKVMYYPAVIWSSLLYGVILGWVVIEQTVDATAFPEIYGFSDLGVGNLNIAAFIGGIIGCLVGGPASDYFVAYISRKQQGYFRPEKRLYFLVLGFIIGPIGLMLWGAGLHNQLHWSVPVVGWGITYCVLCLVPTVAITYVVDCYRPLAGETLTGMTAFKNTFAFALSFGEASWIARDGYVASSKCWYTNEIK
ncbi:hypothetical protein HMPREF1624_05167 [Sporothrix schenckii ATCC 58251]|uniref:Major facilitator superfamily (MFS) profile domain-containing protein n=1 Tax=Sporothrix schenckii (strain ATCC 58251 / de Perez 2211183) TaxID=1391915 RepID=U7PRZ3_SPOS1|nr:hypothetical protein HMPREF1624_05167 [Sporothrix schenckii ATCC 58251]